MIRNILVAFLVLAVFLTPVCAYDDVEEYITEDMEDVLPEDIILQDTINYDTLWDSFCDGIKGVLPGVLQNMTSVLSVVVLSAVFNTLGDSLASRGVRECLGYLSSGCIAMAVYNALSAVWEEMIGLLSRINTFMTTLTPVTTLLYSMGGNITTAAVSNAAMGIILTVFETLCYHGIRPMLVICFGFSIISALSGSIDLKPISTFVRKTYTTVLVFTMTSMICILSLQNMLTRPKDSLGIRTIKFAAANSIPIVGGALGEAAATVGVGISAIRGSLGVLAILALLIIILPSVLSMWMNKIFFSFMSALCSVLGLSKEQGVIAGAAELMSFALAITLSSGMMFIISISLFATAGAVTGG
ncbi:MAG: hypothetical protein IKU19_07130 [Clostridia bacterium]|nr:hypothetical protein [Clostridia bacterium]